ncbi:MAG: glycosyl hydrolase family 28 protein [Verrucomicrobiia bacterium]
MRTNTIPQWQGIHCRRRESFSIISSLPLVYGVLLSLALTGLAQADPILPSIPATNFNVTTYGAVGDGFSNNTAAIQATINAAGAAGGGTVEIPAGTYLSGPLTLTNNINLQIDSGATLKMLPLATFTNYPAQNQAYGNLIYAKNASDVEISGSGTIDGQGAAWWTAPSSVFSSRPYMVFFNGGCHRVLMQNITLQNPPKMHIVFKGSDDNITIQGITINTTADDAANTDGIDLVGTSCLVQNCVINSGDDNIAIGSSGGVSTDILITNCAFGVGHGVSIGSNISGGVSNLTVTSCSFDGTDYGIRMKASNTTSSVAQNLFYSNITMSNIVHGAIVIYSYYGSGGIYGTPTTVTPYGASTQAVGSVLFPIWRNITISNVSAVVTGQIAGIIWGRKEVPVTNVVLHSVNISAPSTFNIYNAQGVQFIDSQITVPGTTNTLNLYNADITVTNTAASTNLVILGGLATPPTNNAMAFFNTKATITDTNMLGTGSITLGGSLLTFKQSSVNSSNSFSIVAASTLSFTNGSNSLNGALSGAGSLTVNLPSNSSLTLRGDGSGFTGMLIVSNSGTLLINNAGGSGTGTGAVTVLSSATLAGNGYIGGPVTVNGKLAPGNNGVGTLTVSNSLAFSSTSVLQYELGTNSDLTVVSGNLALNGTLNIANAGGFTYGTNTLFRYGGTLTTNGTPTVLTIGTVPDSNLIYTVDISSSGYVKLATVPEPPVASFSGSPTNGVAWLTVSFADTSTGMITNRSWNFGDGGFSSIANPTHTYSNAGVFTVSLTAFGPSGQSTLTRTNLITVTPNHPPVITFKPSVINTPLQVGNLAVVIAGETNIFTTVATDADGDPLTYRWAFGDGTISEGLPTNIASHVYTTNCGPYDVTVTVSDGKEKISSNLTVTVACELFITKLQASLNFAKTNSDSCTLTAAFDPGTGINLTNKVVIDVGGAQVPFTMDAKGKGKGVSNFGSCKLAYNKKTGLWILTVKLAKGSWHAQWAALGLNNATISKPGTSVNMPVVMVIDTDAFAAERSMVYTATEDKSGSAK